MSELTSKKLPESTVNNEDVINELTKSLESSLLASDNAEPSPSSSSKSSDETFVTTAGDSGDATPVPSSHPDFEIGIKDEKESEKKKFDPDDFDSKESDRLSDDESDDEAVDEVALKDLEVSLTSEEKEERKLKAEKHKVEGNDRFKLAEYEASVCCYTEGLKVCPLAFAGDRAVMYSNRAAAKMKLDKNKEAIKDCTKAIENDNNYIKAYYRRAQCYELTELFDESLADFNKILELDPQHQEARRGVLRLPPLIEQRNEKLKTEMLGKLKDLGNLFLRPFGLSTENFQMTQDPESKGYSINFTQGKK